MFVARGSIWGPSPLPELLRTQLHAHGLTPDDAGRCARMINERPAGAATASLFVDLGACKYLEGDVDGAIAAWRHVVSRPHDAAAARSLLNLGLLYEHLQLCDHTMGLFDAVASRDVDPHVAPAAMASARCRVGAGQAERAMETMARLAQRTMARDPDDPELVAVLYGLGEVALQAGRVDRAERAWRVAAVSPPSAVQLAARERLISLLEGLGRMSDALDVIGHEPGDRHEVAPATLIDLAESLAATDDVYAARRLMSLIDLAELDAATGFRLADCRRRCGLVNEAIDVLELLLARDGDEVQLHAAYLLGEIYRSFDMPGPARSILGRVTAAQHRYWTPRAEKLLADLDRGHTEPGELHGAADSGEAAATRRPVEDAGDAHDPVERQPVEDDDGVVDLREPVVVVLETESDGAPAVGANGASAFVDHLDDAKPQNPYAALAPEEPDTGPSTRNPYAELAPGFGGDEYEPPEDVKPGDWESMLEDWTQPAGKKRSSAFSRYT